MEYRIIESDRSQQDPSGMEGFLGRMDRELRAGGPPIEGFRFLNSSAEMLRISREIESEALIHAEESSTLYVGFQTSEKLAIETKRYQKIREAGVNVVGFGNGEGGEEGVACLEQWVNLSLDKDAFENQWYLVTRSPSPIVFIGWETSQDPHMFGQGGISTQGKEFRGFVSSDLRVVDGAIAHLERVRKQYGPSHPMPVGQLVNEIPFPVQKVLVVTDNGENKEMSAVRQAAAELAAQKSAYLMLYDLSAASYLVNPYPSSEYVKDWTRPLQQKELRMIGRGYLVDQLNQMEDKGVCAGAILPTEHGFGPLAQWAEREQADLIMVPSHLAKSSPVGRIKDYTLNHGTVAGAFFAVGTLVDRIKGYTLKSLREKTSIPVLVYEPSGQVSMLTGAGGGNNFRPEQSPVAGPTTEDTNQVAPVL